MVLFADDTTMYITGKQISEIYKDMNNELEILVDWFRANKLSLNSSKTKGMLMFYRSRPRQREDVLLIISNNIIQRTTCKRFLVLHINDALNWQFEYLMNGTNHYVFYNTSRLGCLIISTSDVTDSLFTIYTVKLCFLTMIF